MYAMTLLSWCKAASREPSSYWPVARSGDFSRLMLQPSIRGVNLLSLGCSSSGGCLSNWRNRRYGGGTNEESSSRTQSREGLVAGRSRGTSGSFAAERARYREGKIRSQPPPRHSVWLGCSRCQSSQSLSTTIPDNGSSRTTPDMGTRTIFSVIPSKVGQLLRPNFENSFHQLHFWAPRADDR